MVTKVAAYLDQLKALLPPGKAWTRAPGSGMERLLLAPADAMAAVDDRAQDLLDEADPRTADEMFGDWERIAGLPDPCAGPDQSLDSRRAQLLAKLTQVGNETPARLIAAADAVGFGVTIEERAPIGCEDDCEGAVDDEICVFTFIVHADATTIDVMSCEGSCEDALETYGDDVLECVINGLKPAHTFAVFAYGA